MKAIVVRQPWATLIALGIKTIETRPSPPNGPMRPDGVRGLPGLAVERGERIAIVAGTQRPKPGTVGEWHIDSYPPPRYHTMWRLEGVGRDRLPSSRTLPLGAVVCTMEVADALPIELVLPKADRPPGYRQFAAKYDRITTHPLSSVPTLYRMTNGNGFDIADQLPLGDFTPGRWGWMLTDPRPCDPVPCKGRQGVFALPDDVAAMLKEEG